MPKAQIPSFQFQFQGRRDFPPEPHLDDWGLTPSQQESYVEQFRRLLASKNAWREDKHDYYVLRRFLRARSYDMEKAVTMWMNNLKFKSDFGVDTILQDFVFTEREPFLKAFPQGYHKTDKQGRPIYIQLLGQVKVDQIKKVTTEDRMVRFHIQEYERCCKVILPVCSHLQGRNIDQTFGIMDVKGVGLSHLTGDVKRLLGTIAKYDQDNYPEMLGHICIINAPAIFKYVWGFVKGLLDPRTQQKIEILGTDYMPGLLKWMEIDSIPDWLGGKSHGSLEDDVGPWSNPDVLDKLGMDVEDLKLGHRPAPALTTMPSTRLFGHSVEGTGIGRTSVGSISALREALSGGPGSVSIRQHSDVSDGYHSPMNSTHDVLAVHRLRDDHAQSSRVPSAAGSARGSLRLSGEHAMNGNGAFEPIPEQPASATAALPATITSLHLSTGGATASAKQATLMQRVQELEAMLAPHREQIQAALIGKAVGPAAASGQSPVAALSSKSAPQGSLLYRVEMLEDAMNMLLAAQQAVLVEHQRLEADRLRLEQEQEALREQHIAQEQQNRSGACCCIM